MSDIQPPSHHKILVIRFSSIGDIVLTTPIIRSIKKQLPDAEVHFLVKKCYQSLLEANPYIDKIHTYNGDSKLLLQELKDERFTFIADLQKNIRSKRIVRGLSCPSKSFSKCNVKKLILVRTKINFLPRLHIVERYFKSVAPIGVVNDNQGLDYFIPEEDRFDTQELPAAFENGYIAVAVGAQHATKRIPFEKIIEIGSQVFKPMILLGDKNDIAAGEQIVTALGAKVLNFCGKCSIHTSASIVGQSDCVLTADTGLMHIAAALRKPIASLWGNTMPELGMYPYTAPDAPAARIFETPYLKCRPCSKLGYNKCPRGHFKCMNDISAFEVANWLNQF